MFIQPCRRCFSPLPSQLSQAFTSARGLSSTSTTPFSSSPTLHATTVAPLPPRLRTLNDARRELLASKGNLGRLPFPEEIEDAVATALESGDTERALVFLEALSETESQGDASVAAPSRAPDWAPEWQWQRALPSVSSGGGGGGGGGDGGDSAAGQGDNSPSFRQLVFSHHIHSVLLAVGKSISATPTTTAAAATTELCDRVVSLVVHDAPRRLSPAIVRTYLGLMAASTPPDNARAFAFCDMVQATEAGARKQAGESLTRVGLEVGYTMLALRLPQTHAQLRDFDFSPPHITPFPYYHLVEGGGHGAYVTAVLDCHGKGGVKGTLDFAMGPECALDSLAAASIAKALAAKKWEKEAKVWLDVAAAKHSSVTSVAPPSSKFLDGMLVDTSVVVALAGFQGTSTQWPRRRFAGVAAAATTACEALALAPNKGWAPTPASLPLDLGVHWALEGCLSALEALNSGEGGGREGGEEFRPSLTASLPPLLYAAIVSPKASPGIWKRGLGVMMAGGGGGGGGVGGVGMGGGGRGGHSNLVFSVFQAAINTLGTSQAWHVMRSAAVEDMYVEASGGGGTTLATLLEAPGGVGFAASAAAAVGPHRHHPPTLPGTLAANITTWSLNSTLSVMARALRGGHGGGGGIGGGGLSVPSLPPPSTPSTLPPSPGMYAHDLLASAWAWSRVFSTLPSFSRSSSESLSQGLYGSGGVSKRPPFFTPPFFASPEKPTYLAALTVALRAKDESAQRGITSLMRSSEGELGGVGSDGRLDPPSSTHHTSSVASAVARGAWVLRQYNAGELRGSARDELAGVCHELYCENAPWEAVRMLQGMAAAGMELRGDTLSVHLKGLVKCGGEACTGVKQGGEEGGSGEGEGRVWGEEVWMKDWAPPIVLPLHRQGRNFSVCDVKELRVWLERERGERGGASTLQTPATTPVPVLAELGLKEALGRVSFISSGGMGGNSSRASQPLIPPPSPPLPSQDPLPALLPYIMRLHTRPSNSSFSTTTKSSTTTQGLLEELGEAGDGAVAFALHTLSPIRAAQLFVGLWEGGVLGVGGRGGGVAPLSALTASQGARVVDVRELSPNTVGVAVTLMLDERKGDRKRGVLFVVTGRGDGANTLRALHCCEGWEEGGEGKVRFSTGVKGGALLFPSAVL